ncbi:uncharacterized protein LOC125562943 [Nematostella vectensis]|uniref:uncharacterized protein LOC125562943 n=1 Tax=Nematostella vectensis TaxID=45351 RepID=UPI002077074E|nr:uncharacterized protein LOC125562943 [Nematostella vectensis]
MNPGPVKHPCGACGKPTKSNQKAICCDECGHWMHAKCIYMSCESYQRYVDESKLTWICNICAFPNFSSGHFVEDTRLIEENSFAPLADSSLEGTSMNGANDSDLLEPPRCISSSTPVRPTRRGPRNPAKLTCMEINCNSIQSSERAAIFASHVSTHKPDIIFGCESKLSPEDPTAASFPSDYNVFRKERSGSGGGGIFIAVKHDIPSYELPDITTNPEDESLWAAIRCANKKTVYICAFYKPPDAPATRLDFLQESIFKVFSQNKKSHPNIVISGDFNCGDIDWRNDPPSITNHSTASMMQKLLDLISNNALIQHVTKPTRPVSLKTLDLVISSTPALVSDITIHPGMSDHDIVKFNINTKTRRIKTPPHKVYLYNKMDLAALKRDVAKLSEDFTLCCEERSLEKNWSFFEDRLKSAVESHIPYRFTKSKTSLPWITQSVKRQIRKRDRLLSKALKSNNKNSQAWRNYRHQRNHVVKLLKAAHNHYLNTVIGGSLGSNPKKFWSHVKHSRTESRGIPTLRQGNSMFISDKDKAEALNKYFESVFTMDDGVVPDLDPPTCPKISDIPLLRLAYLNS